MSGDRVGRWCDGCQFLGSLTELAYGNILIPSSLDFVTRNVELARRLRAGVAMDLLVYTPEEMERMHDRPFLRHILKTGKVLYESKSA